MVRERPELLAASDHQIAEAVRLADPMVLRGLLFQLTADQDLAPIEIAREVTRGYRETYTVAQPADAELIRAKAAAFLTRYRDAGAGEISIGPSDRLRQSLSLTAGVDVAEAEMELWLEHLALDPWARSARWASGEPPIEATDFPVVVIGAGMGGLNAAVHLKRLGIPFAVLEKNGDVGGTWHENRYPGARVDSPSRIYTHIYGADFPYPSPFCAQADNEKYFNWVADAFEVRPDIEFHTEVRSVTWDDATNQWEIIADQPSGRRTWYARAVISAVGFLSQPNVPAFEGIESFRGRSFHTARWPADLDISGKRVAVIGTGCTGYQLIPEIVSDAEHVTIFQRTPNWIFEAPGYLAPFAPEIAWMDRNFPFYTNFARFQIAYLLRPQMAMKGLLVDPDFQDEHAVSVFNREIRRERLAFLEKKLGNHPDLLHQMTPTAPPMSARPVLVDATYSILDVLPRDDVTLVSQGIRRIRPEGIETLDGSVHEVDVIVLATGFRAADYLWPMEVRGREGLPLERLWARDGARAYVGAMLPGFPNFFMIYGPNTNVLAGFQIVDVEEMTTRFALELIRALIEQRKSRVEVTEAAYWQFNAMLDQAESTMTYVDHRSRNYFKNEFGRSPTNAPIDSRLLWDWLRDPLGQRDPIEDLVSDEALTKQRHSINPRVGADILID